VAVAILMGLNIRLTVLGVETARLERRGVNDMARSVKQARKAMPKFKVLLKQA
jgi:hypothetical protein